MPVVALLTDFGSKDTYVAEVKAMLLRAKPTLVDLTHDVPSYDIDAGAFHLWRSFRYFPKETWFLAVVDPGVGTQRRAVYIKTRNYHFVGPDNGLLSWAVRECESTEGKAKYYQILSRESIAPTFHGRDLFAPFITSHLLGKPQKKEPVLTISGSSFPVETKHGKTRVGTILMMDHYGNAVTSLRVSGEANISHAVVQKHQIKLARNYGSIAEGRMGLISGSHGLWEIAAKENSAAKKLGLKKGDTITLFLL